MESFRILCILNLRKHAKTFGASSLLPSSWNKEGHIPSIEPNKLADIEFLSVIENVRLKELHPDGEISISESKCMKFKKS